MPLSFHVLEVTKSFSNCDGQVEVGTTTIPRKQTDDEVDAREFLDGVSLLHEVVRI